MEQCTFKPKINKRSRAHDGRKTQGGAGVSSIRKQNVPDRLHHEADSRAIARQKMRRRLERQVRARFDIASLSLSPSFLFLLFQFLSLTVSPVRNTISVTGTRVLSL